MHSKEKAREESAGKASSTSEEVSGCWTTGHVGADSGAASQPEASAIQAEAPRGLLSPGLVCKKSPGASSPLPPLTPSPALMVLPAQDESHAEKSDCLIPLRDVLAQVEIGEVRLGDLEVKSKTSRNP